MLHWSIVAWNWEINFICSALPRSSSFFRGGKHWCNMILNQWKIRHIHLAILWNFLLFPTGAWIEFIFLKNVGIVVNVASIIQKGASISFCTLVAVVNNSRCSSKVVFQPRKSWPSVSTSGSFTIWSVQIAFFYYIAFSLREELAYCAEVICLASDIEAWLTCKCLYRFLISLVDASPSAIQHAVHWTGKWIYFMDIKEPGSFCHLSWKQG